jgi:hypothetical protein
MVSGLPLLAKFHSRLTTNSLIFGHKWLRLPGGCEVAREKLRAVVSELREARWEPMFGFLIMP